MAGRWRGLRSRRGADPPILSSTGTLFLGDLNRRVLLVTPDHSVELSDGSVLYFSVERFVREIVDGGRCFICGRAPHEVIFNDEHVIPNWVLRYHRLHRKVIILPNQNRVPYSEYKIPCCAECNSRLGREVEEQVQPIIAGGFYAVQAHLADRGPDLLFRWLALLFLKTHLKDLHLRFHLDGRKGDERIGSYYAWESLHHVFCIARSLLANSEIREGVVGSFICFRVKCDETQSFDYGDTYSAKTVFVRSGDVAIAAVLNDACCASSAIVPALRSVANRHLSTIQVREVVAGLAYANSLLIERPIFRSTFDVGVHQIVCQIPGRITLREHDPKEWGSLLFHFCGQSMVGTSEWARIEEPLRDGRYTFLVDEAGIPMV